MEKIILWVAEKFHQPLTIILFVLGALLVLLGVTEGLPILSAKMRDDYRLPALIMGCVFIALGVVLHFVSPKAGKGVPEDFKKSFLNRWAALSGKQKDILTFVQRSHPNELLISHETIQKNFGACPETELTYRLEQLRLLGFIERQEMDEDKYAYRLSVAYKREVGNLPPRPAMSQWQTQVRAAGVCPVCGAPLPAQGQRQKKGSGEPD